jgi:hypothetical protein
MSLLMNAVLDGSTMNFGMHDIMLSTSFATQSRISLWLLDPPASVPARSAARMALPARSPRNGSSAYEIPFCPDNCVDGRRLARRIMFELALHRTLATVQQSVGNAATGFDAARRQAYE